MSKKESKKSAPKHHDNKLTHNPFARLQGQLDLPAGEAKAPPPSATADETQAKPKRSLGRLIQRRETKHRGGKAVIIVSGFAALTGFDRDAVETLSKELKAKLGCGGTVEDEGAGLQIVIQGDQAKKVAEHLRARGFRVDGVVS